MNIEILDMKKEEVAKKIAAIYNIKDANIETDIEKKASNQLMNIISNREIKEMFTNLQDHNYISGMSYRNLAKIEETTKVLSENISKLKKEVELDKFFKKGYNLDIDKLKEMYRKQKLKDKFPKLDFKKIRELYITPPEKLDSYYDENKKILVDDFVFRKYMLAVLQMIFNHMDFVVCNIGDEGAGKSCKCSQDMYMLWWMMTEIGLIDYKFEIKEIFANTLDRFSELEDKYFGVPFRIIGLDEGNELNRQDWKEDSVKLFWQRLRRERHEQRIKFVNIPVLGEMIINIVLSRINFIFNMLNRNENKTGTLYKGDYDFYIIPRGDNIYSPFLNRNLKKEEIKNKLYNNLKDKEYLKGLPKDIKIKRCFCNGVWGFKEKDYLKEMKDTNKKYHITKGLKITTMELYCFFKARVTLGRLNVSRDELIYPTLNKMLFRVKSFWNNDPELLLKYDNIYKQKEEEKEKYGTLKPRTNPIKDTAPKKDNAAPDLAST